jgi:hypothetical protein
MVHNVISGLYKVNINCWILSYDDKTLRGCSQNSRIFGNMNVRKTPGSALWSVTKKCVVVEIERLPSEKFIYK